MKIKLNRWRFVNGSIHFISGKPGGGKSLYAVKLVIEELVMGTRQIITNLALRPGELRHYLDTHYPQSNVDVASRLWQLNEEQTKYFWTYRPDGCRIRMLTKEEWAKGKTPSYAKLRDKGVMYVLDEVHNFFSARQWQETGRDVLFYLSQHRKLGDTVVCITQAVENVDKQFRSVTQDFTFLRNLSKERYGFFKLPGVFLRKTFSCPPGPLAVPMETGTFRLDVSGIARCYDSAAGVGIHGRAADMGEKAKGVHWSAAVLLVALIAFFVVMVCPKVLAHYYTAPLKSVVSAKQPDFVGVSNALPAAVHARSVSPVVMPVSSTNRVTGMAQLGPGRLAVTLSDGSIVRTPSPRITEWGVGWVVFDGRRVDL